MWGNPVLILLLIILVIFIAVLAAKNLGIAAAGMGILGGGIMSYDPGALFGTANTDYISAPMTTLGVNSGATGIGPGILVGGVDEINLDGLVATNDFIDKFNDGATMAVDEMEGFAENIAYDAGGITVATLKKSKSAVAKLVTDTLLHAHIYKHRPNNLSRSALEKNIKLISSIAGGTIEKSKINTMNSKIREILADGKSTETKMPQPSPRECFRREQIVSILGDITSSTTDANLRDEISRKNLEIAALKIKLADAGTRPSLTSNLSTGILLDDCLRDRKMLQERIYDLRREIDSIRSSSSGNQANERIAALMAQNQQLQQQLVQLTSQQQQQHAGDTSAAEKMRDELQNCQQLLEQVLNENDKLNNEIGKQRADDHPNLIEELD